MVATKLGVGLYRICHLLSVWQLILNPSCDSFQDLDVSFITRNVITVTPDRSRTTRLRFSAVVKANDAKMYDRVRARNRYDETLIPLLSLAVQPRTAHSDCR
jgi:hypothetical protein